MHFFPRLSHLECHVYCYFPHFADVVCFCGRSCSCVLVSDGEHTTPEMDFAVLLLSNHQQPPLFQVLDPVLEVSMGGQVPIGKRRIHTFRENALLRSFV